MKHWLKRIFGNGERRTVPDQHEVRLAAVALLYEVMRADGEHSPEELQGLVDRLLHRWRLDEEEALEVLREAQMQAENAVDYHQLVMRLREGLDAEQRAELIADMWEVALADGEIDQLEEYVIRKVADLLYVSHSDFIRGKLRHTL